MIDNETIFECPVCHKPIDTEEYYPKDHEDHIEEAFHALDIDCPTCEGDDPIHCPVYCENVMDSHD